MSVCGEEVQIPLLCHVSPEEESKGRPCVYDLIFFI